MSETAVVETEVAPPDPPGPPPGSLSARLHGMSVARLREYGILLPFVGLFVTLSLASGPFFTKVNLLNILDQQSGTMVVAAAGTLVVIAGGIDLSVGATYSLGGVVAAELCEHGHSPGLSIVLGILAGFGVGLLNGLLVTIGKINALIATLAMAFVIGGACLAGDEGQPRRPAGPAELRQVHDHRVPRREVVDVDHDPLRRGDRGCCSPGRSPAATCTRAAATPRRRVWRASRSTACGCSRSRSAAALRGSPV